jgi:hypothetical protein
VCSVEHENEAWGFVEGEKQEAAALSRSVTFHGDY